MTISGKVISGCAIFLLAAGVATFLVQAQRRQEWRKDFDVAALDRVPRTVAILPGLSGRSKDINGWREYHGMLLGLNATITNIFTAAYSTKSSRLIFSIPAPEGKYDFISNVPKNQRPALQQEIAKTFHLGGRKQSVETNVLSLTVRNRHAPGLKSSASGQFTVDRPDGFIVVSNMPVSNLGPMTENLLGMPVVDRTGLKGYFDLKWKNSNDGLKKAILENLGLELVPGSASVEFLVIEKNN